MDILPLIENVGRLADLVYREIQNFILCSVNSISIEPYGVAKSLQDEYDYEEVRRKRWRLFDLSRADVSSRGTPGTVIVQHPSRWS